MSEALTDFSMQLPTPLYEEVKRFAHADERPMAYVIRKAVREYLDAHEPDRKPADSNGDGKRDGKKAGK